MTNNVIRFPKIKLDAPAQTPEELAVKIEEYKRSFADDIAEFLWQHVIVELSRAGCNFNKNTEELYPSIVLVLESIRSLHLHANEVEHPLQDIARQLLEEDEENEDLQEEMVDIPETVD